MPKLDIFTLLDTSLTRHTHLFSTGSVIWQTISRKPYPSISFPGSEVRTEWSHTGRSENKKKKQLTNHHTNTHHHHPQSLPPQVRASKPFIKPSEFFFPKPGHRTRIPVCSWSPQSCAVSLPSRRDWIMGRLKSPTMVSMLDSVWVLPTSPCMPYQH